MKLLKILLVALLCMTLLLSVTACIPEETPSGDSNASQGENNGDNGTPDNGTQDNGDTPDGEIPNPPQPPTGGIVDPNDPYPNYGQEFTY